MSYSYRAQVGRVMILADGDPGGDADADFQRQVRDALREAAAHIQPRPALNRIRARIQSRDRRHPCRCGHARGLHQHYRPGINCGLCHCLRYRRGRRSALVRLITRLRRGGDPQ